MMLADSLAVTFSSFTLIALAEIGDKSQLVCMTLAARHRHWPVILGASAAFLILNLLAVIFGSVIAEWIPEIWITWLVALLFAVFGIQSLMTEEEGEDEIVEEKTGHSIFLVTFLLILVAEFGDKTQIAVAGLASSLPPIDVWIGASLALILISVLGVWAGRTILQRLPIIWLHRIGGIVFLVFSGLAVWKAITA